MDEEEITGPVPITSFYWFFKKGDTFEHTTDGGREIVLSEINIGGAERRFLPTSVTSALAYFYTHPDAEGLRLSESVYQLGVVSVGAFDPEPDEDGNVPEMPEGYVETPEVLDFSTEFPDEFDDYGMKGAYVQTPLKFTAKVMLKNRHATTKEKLVRSVGMVMMSPEEIRKMSVLEVKNHNIMTQTKSPSPVPNGPADGRLGASDRQSECQTCSGIFQGKPHETCPGHFGHIELAEPVPHVLFAISNDLTNVLNMFCHHCGKIPIKDEDRYNQVLTRMERIHKVSKNASGLTRIRNLTKKAIEKEKVINKEQGVIMCPHCEMDSPMVDWNLNRKKFLLRPARLGKGGPNFYPYSNVYLMLQSISDTEARMMGFDAPEMRPEYMFLKALPVAPNTLRPMQEDFETGKPIENDLTLMYAQAVRRSNIIREAKAGGQDPGRIQTTLVADLFTRVAQCYYNQNASIGMFGAKTVGTRAGGSKNTIRAGLLDNLSGYGSKKTIFRRRMNSKVVNNVIRSVITASGDLSVNEVGVPMVSCLNTFVRVRVTEDNLDFLTELVIRGLPNAKRQPSKNNKMAKERYPGAWWVERYGLPELGQFALQDAVLWNSSPNALQNGWTAFGEEWVEHMNTLPEDISKELLKEEEWKFEWEINMRKRREIFGQEGERPLRVGDIVARTVLPGDYVLFGRQPSLHRQSLNGLRVVPLDQHAISFNPAICVPFNADYDGDQMNIYVPGSEEAMNEIRDKLQMRDNLIHHRMGKMVIGTDHDQTSGVYLLTMKHKSKAGTFDESTGVGFNEDGVVLFTRARMLDLFSKIYHKDDDGVMHYITDIGEPDHGELYSGYRAMSLIIPKGINARFSSGILYNEDGTMSRNEKGKPNKDTTVIIDGEVITGTLDKTFMGKEKGTLGPAFYYRFGYEEGAKQMQKFIDMLCRLGFAAHHSVGYSMGVADCGLPITPMYEMQGDEQVFVGVDNPYEDIRAGYDTTSEVCMEINRDFVNRNLQKYVEDDKWLAPDYSKMEKQQILDANPYQFRQMLIYEAQDSWEGGVAQAVSEIAGADNAMEIAVRSGGRGKELNIQQMGAAYGQVRISGVLPSRGLQGKGYHYYPPGGEDPVYVDFGGHKRMFAHYPLNGKPIEHPAHYGYVKNSYYTGMEPHEFFTVCIAGRRSAMESSSGALQDSGYLANKIRRGLESIVVDKHGRTVDLRDGSIIAFRSGGDGFRAYNSKMVHRFPDGNVEDDFSVNMSDEDLTIELQPFFFDFSCKHNVPLAMDCDQCAKGSAHVSYFADTFGPKWNNPRLVNAVVNRLASREVMKPVVKKMIDRLDWWANENKVQPGEAIGSTAAGCLAEPATQGSLRTFHAGGKGAGTSVTRLKQIVENTSVTTPKMQVFTYVDLLPQFWNEESAQRIANWCTPYNIEDILEVVDYDIPNKLCIFNLDMEQARLKDIDMEFLTRQIKRALKSANAPAGNLIAEIGDGNSFVVKVEEKSSRGLLNMRDFISLTQVSGIQQGGPTYITRKDGKYGLQIDSAHEKVWQSLSELLTDFVDVDSLWCDNPKTVEKFLGIEAALASVTDQLNYQMNAKSGIGDYDYRYVSTVAGAMANRGRLVGHGPGQATGPQAINTFDAMAMEDVKTHFRAGVTMGNVSDMRSVTGSTIAGRAPLIGDELLRYS